MSCCHFRHVLAVLDQQERATWAVLDRAVELAEAERARLTLAQTTDPGLIVKWFAPLAMLSRVGCAVEFDLERFARDRLARASEFVPASIPLTTVLLGTDTPCAVRRLATHDVYDLVVINSALLARSHRLRREIRRLELCALTVSPQSSHGEVEELGIADGRLTRSRDGSRRFLRTFS